MRQAAHRPIYLALSSNMMPEICLSQASYLLSIHFKGLIEWSPIYRSAAYGGYEGYFDNQAAILYTDLPAASLKTIFKAIERACGRTPESKIVGRIPLDIDLVRVEDEILKPRDWADPTNQAAWQQLLLRARSH